MRTLLETIQAENFIFFNEIKDFIQRNYAFPLAENMIKVAIGIRRSGKTHFLYQTIQQLRLQGVSFEQILLINFEDDRLLPMNAKVMGELLDAFYTLYPQNHERRCYFFLDEVQNVTEWQQVVRRFYDTKNAQLYLTGSSAKLLSKEIHTSLRGRSLSLEIYPYSFQEYLQAHQINVNRKQPFGQKIFDQLYQQLQHYLQNGGFPAVQNMIPTERLETLQSYVNTVMFRDIVERYHISNITVLKYFITMLLKNAASTFSIHKFHNDLKSQGYKIGKDTLHLYLRYIEDTFLIFTVSAYSESERLKQTQPKKIYAIDTGIMHALSLNINELHGKCFENLIYLDLKRQKKEIYFYTTQEGFEIDFITIDKNQQRECIQVAWDITDKKTLEREQRALSAAEKELGISGRIITPRDYLRQFVIGEPTL